MFNRKYLLLKPEDDSGGGGATVSPPAASPAAAPAAAAPAPAAAEVKATWPDNWRDLAARGDGKVSEQLARFASPEAVVDSYMQARKRISEGSLVPRLSKDATPEELKEWRTANGIPEAPEKYDLSAVGMKADAEAIKPFLELAHKTNQTPEQVQATLKFVAEMAQNSQAAQAESDGRAKVTYEDTMRAEWGPEFRANTNAVHGLLDGMVKQEFKEQFLNARLPDGKRVGDSPDAMRMLMSLALVRNPAARVIPGNDNPLKGIEDRLSEIHKYMRTNRADYFKDSKMQAEYRELLQAQEKLKS